MWTLHFAIVTDAWKPQASGVVENRSWRRPGLQLRGHLSPRTRATADAQPESRASR